MWEILERQFPVFREKKEGNGRFKANSDFSPATHTKLGWKECGELTSGQNQQLHTGRKRNFVLPVSFCKLPISGQISFSSKPIHFRLSGRRFFFRDRWGKRKLDFFSRLEFAQKKEFGFLFFDRVSDFPPPSKNSRQREEGGVFFWV